MAEALAPGVVQGVSLSLLERLVPYRDSLAATAAVCVVAAALAAPLALRARGLARQLDE
jgi:hypothetical protein